ncbi:MAG: prolipoprotein diacylglyceryl transferase [Verrucomicrobiota bacterium]
MPDPAASVPLAEHFTVHDWSPFLVEFTPGIGLRYYGLAYLLGFLGLYLGLHWQIKKGWLRLKPEDVTNFITAMIVGVLAGGRLFYCFYYGWEAWQADWLFPLKLWEGGMASHGGILGAIAAIFLYARWTRVPFYHLADATALCTPPALFLGRIANFINGELWGRPSTVSWARIFPDARPVPVDSLAPAVREDLIAHYGVLPGDWINVPRHPSQLYEAALEGLVLFGLLLAVRLLTRRDAFVALGFIGGYAILRAIAEIWRAPDEHMGFAAEGLTHGQLLSLGQVALAVVLAVIEYRRQNRRRALENGGPAPPG